MKSVAGVVSVLVLFSGCAENPFEKNYSPQPGSETAHSSPRYEHPTGEAKIYAYSGDTASDNIWAQEEGYEYLGMSSFFGHAESLSREQIIKQAKNVGASMVFVQTKYKDTLSGAVPNTVNGYGSGGIGAAAYSKYSTTSTQSGLMTNDVPYSVTRYDTVATYWARRDMNQVPLGVVAESLPEDVRGRLRRNTGVIAIVVMRGTPAFNANIRRNDVILRIGGEDVIDPDGFDGQLIKFEGQTVDIELLRGDTPKTVAVTLNRQH